MNSPLRLTAMLDDLGIRFLLQPKQPPCQHAWDVDSEDRWLCTKCGMNGNDCPTLNPKDTA